MKKQVLHIGLLGILVIVLYSIGPHESTAEETLSRDGVYTLGEVVVVGKKKEVTACGTNYLITAEAIQNTGAVNLADALELLPGLSIRVGGAGTPRIDIRGFKTRHVMLLLDGMPVNDTYDGQFDPTAFPVEHIAEIKVTTGGGSVLYGPGGNGGVINIITKKGQTGLHFSIGGEYGTGDAVVSNATVSGGTESLNYFISAGRESVRAYPLSDDFTPTPEEDGDSRANSDSERNTLYTNLGYAVTDVTRLGLTLNGYQGENGVPPYTDKDESDPFNKSPKYDRVDDLQGFSAQLAFSHLPDTGFGIRSWLYRNEQEMQENRYGDGTYTTREAAKSYENNTETAITGISSQLSYDLASDSKEWLNATLGLNYENHSWEADGFEMVGSGGGGGGGGSGGGSTTAQKEIFSADEDINITSVALECELTPVSQFGLVLGVSQHFMDGNHTVEDEDASYLVGARYDVTDATRFRASYSRKVRFPSLKQLYDIDDGNPDLETEKSIQYEIGLVQDLPAASSLTTSAYYTDVEDYIEKVSGPYENFDEYLFKGVDISFETQFIDNLTLRASYGFLDSEDKSSNSEREELQYRPKHKYTFESTYAFDNGLMIHGDILHMADQHYYADDNGALLKRQLSNYTLVNTRIAYTLLNEMLTVYIRCENLFDNNYEESYDLPQAGRTVYGGFNLRF